MLVVLFFTCVFVVWLFWCATVVLFSSAHVGLQGGAPGVRLHGCPCATFFYLTCQFLEPRVPATHHCSQFSCFVLQLRYCHMFCTL
jgi:hypothetical protein